MRTLRNGFVRLLCSLIAVGSLAVAAPASADVVSDWNTLAVQFVNAGGTASQGPFAVFDLAMIHIAIHDAVQAYQDRFKTFAGPYPNGAGSPVAAVAAAAHDVLVSRFRIPAVNASLIAQVDAAYASYLASKGLAVN